jgi:hypothetical protein
VEAGEVVLPDGVEPVGEALALAFGEHGREGPGMAGEGVEFRTVAPDRLELELFGFGEGVGVPEDPSGNMRGEGGRAVTGRAEVRFSLR